MISPAYILLVIFTLSIATLADDQDVTAPKKKAEELWYWPITGLILVKFKLLLLAFFVLTGTAAVTKFIAGLVHILAGACKTKQSQPVYIKYKPASHGYYHSYDKPYYTDNDIYYESKKTVERAIRSIESS